MPLFGSRQGPAEEPPRSPTPPQHRGSIFSRRSRSLDGGDSRASPTAASQTSSSTHSNGGFLFRRRRSSDDEMHASLAKDPSIATARRKVADAETAEREADRALSSARMAVREAKEHVKNLEREALEECAPVIGWSCDGADDGVAVRGARRPSKRRPGMSARVRVVWEGTAEVWSRSHYTLLPAVWDI
ncbi:hypothetical protein EVG20_g6162 [Dentipellis fragilis]|uniref:Uncharacterized protein n=1 Tax=Dentipellis fragilis TaxID=205917 RepID=A0A4Y9YNV7_9AGAM|nr:hypothetical protein EVG20_g6162 [Dentipellis fragilis]